MIFDAGEVHLIDVLRLRITQLLRDKEETVMNPASATNWLSNEAASVHHINQAGSFR
jgi:hypothetical protein